jgi:hypothetical protein
MPQWGRDFIESIDECFGDSNDMIPELVVGCDLAAGSSVMSFHCNAL